MRRFDLPSQRSSPVRAGKRPSTRAAALCVALGLGVLPAAASAQQPQGAAETERARELHRQGDLAFRAGRFEEARTAYLAAWGLKKHWQIAANLGDCELRTKRYRDAAEHLAWALRDGRGQMPAELAAATETALAEAKTRVGEARVEVVPAGADVSVNGVVVGQSPLPDPVFLEPGTHVVEAKKVGFLARREEVTAIAGEATPVRLDLKAEGDAGAATPPPGVPPVTAPPEEVGEGLPMWPAAVGGGLAVVAIGVGVGLLVASGGAGSDADALRSELAGTSCAGGTDPRCVELADAVDSESSLGGAAIGSFVGGGVLTVGTIVYAVVASQSGGASTSALRWTPSVGPQLLGTSVAGAF